VRERGGPRSQNVQAPEPQKPICPSAGAGGRCISPSSRWATRRQDRQAPTTSKQAVSRKCQDNGYCQSTVKKRIVSAPLGIFLILHLAQSWPRPVRRASKQISRFSFEFSKVGKALKFLHRCPEFRSNCRFCPMRFRQGPRVGQTMEAVMALDNAAKNGGSGSPARARAARSPRDGRLRTTSLQRCARCCRTCPGPRPPDRAPHVIQASLAICRPRICGRWPICGPPRSRHSAARTWEHPLGVGRRLWSALLRHVPCRGP
jgi:hypothetical protein